MWNDLDDHRIDATKTTGCHTNNNNNNIEQQANTSDPYQSSALSFGKETHPHLFTMKSDVATTKASEASGNSLRNGAVNPVVEVSTQVVEEAIPRPAVAEKADFFDMITELTQRSGEATSPKKKPVAPQTTFEKTE
jgi:hypothetical protein